MDIFEILLNITDGLERLNNQDILILEQINKVHEFTIFLCGITLFNLCFCYYLFIQNKKHKKDIMYIKKNLIKYNEFEEV